MDGVNIEKNEKKECVTDSNRRRKNDCKRSKCTEIFQYGRLKSGIGSIISLIEKESQQNTLLLTLFCKYDLKNGTPLNPT